MINYTRDHEKAKELGRHQLRVQGIKDRAQHWRLTDCDEPTLVQMRHALIEEMERLEKTLSKADDRFLAYVKAGRPLDTERERENIERLTTNWEALNIHLQEVDEALLERHLHTQLVTRLGSENRVNWLETLVFIAVILVVSLTLADLILPFSSQTSTLIHRIDTIICIFLIADFILRWTLSEDKGWYVRRYWLDLISSIPFTEAIVFGQFFRYARLLRLVRIIRAIRVIFHRYRSLDKLFQTFQMNLLKRSVYITLLLLLVGALGISLFEGQESPVHGVAGSIWWSFTTAVTGGFVDIYNPTTVGGRLVTVGLVLLGLTVTGIFTASLTSVLVEDESTRIERNQHTLELHIGILNQKLDLLSSETNEGLIALETVSQSLSNQTSARGLADVLTETMMQSFECLQASVHLLDDEQKSLHRIIQKGLPQVAPAQQIPLGTGAVGRIVAELLAHDDITTVDLEPETEISIGIDGIVMICPLVAGGKLLGALHVVLPDTLARFYLYNRVPMTLAHHAAMGFLMIKAQRNGTIVDTETTPVNKATTPHTP